MKMSEKKFTERLKFRSYLNSSSTHFYPSNFFRWDLLLEMSSGQCAHVEGETEFLVAKGR